MTGAADSNTLTALNHQLDRVNEEISSSKERGDYPLSRNRLIEELKSNTELRQAVKDVLVEDVKP